MFKQRAPWLAVVESAETIHITNDTWLDGAHQNYRHTKDDSAHRPSPVLNHTGTTLASVIASADCSAGKGDRRKRLEPAFRSERAPPQPPRPTTCALLANRCRTGESRVVSLGSPAATRAYQCA
jgi:hypothetical protein